MVIERCWNDTDKGKLKLSGEKPRNVFKIRPILLSKHSRSEHRYWSLDIVGPVLANQWHAAFTAVSISFLLPYQRLYILRNVYIYIYLTAYRLHMNYRCYQITLQCSKFTQIGELRFIHWIFIVGAPVWW